MAVSSLVSATNVTGTIASIGTSTTSADIFTIPAGKTYKLVDLLIQRSLGDLRLYVNSQAQIATESTVSVSSAFLKAGDTLQIRNVSVTDASTNITYYLAFLVTEFTP